MKKVAFVTNIAANEFSGGFSAMNRAMFDLLSTNHSVDYIGPVNPKPNLWQHALSKSGRVLGLGGDFFFFSERRLEAICREVDPRLAKSRAEYAVFHGFTPWIHTRPVMPYIAWSDCTFWQYVHIYHDAGCFRALDLERIKEKEAAWLRNAEKVIFRNNWAAAEAIRDYQLDENRVAVVGNYGLIKPPSGDLYKGGRDFLMVTTNFRQKGGPLAVAAFRQVRKAYPDTRLLIVGDHPGIRVLLERGVVYLGWLSKSNPDDSELLSQTFARSMCLLHPTISDTNPMVLIEAGYCGCPAISTNRFAIPELVGDGTTGLLLKDPTDVSAIVNAMIWMLRQSESYLHMRKAVRAKMLEQYTKESFQQRLVSEIRRVEERLQTCTAPPPQRPTSFDSASTPQRPRLLINFITSIPLSEFSGGFSSMNLAAYEALKEIADVHYVGPINPKISLFKKAISKSSRIAGFPGDFYFFSKGRHLKIAKEIEARALPDADLDFYHGFTPWVLSNTGRPYVAWSDCSFRDYINIYHNPQLFLKNSIGRICADEKKWMKSALSICLSSKWAQQRVIQQYDLPSNLVHCVGIFGAMDPPSMDMWSGSKDFYFISTDYRQKNGSLCRKAMDYVWADYPEARLRIVGDKPPAGDLIDGKVIYEGFFRKSVPSELAAFHQHLAGAFALVHPTSADTTAMIVIEAAFFGCPAITVDDFALREVTSSDNWRLLLSRPFSAQDIAERMINLLANPELYQVSRAAARSHAILNLTRPAFKSRLQRAVLDIAQNA
jgi:glycosyltransferase involved in cell wall biosynthesis